MIFFITCLRALAACLITNNHYSGIYPNDFLAKGGMIGNLLFFTISGYCLYDVKPPFSRWYSKRLWRIYLPTIVVTSVYVLLGCYSISGGGASLREFVMSVVGWQELGQNTASWFFLYPTKYHFVASIVILYVPFYSVMRIKSIRDRLSLVLFVVGLFWFLSFFFLYDRTRYAVMNTREPFVRWLFFEGMLLGAWFRQKDQWTRNKLNLCIPAVVGTILLIGIYFVVKAKIENLPQLYQYQIILPLINLAVIALIFQTFSSLDAKLESLKGWMKKFISLISKLTLEIYLVQFVIIDHCKSVGSFPLKWILTTFTILVAAYVLHTVCSFIFRGIDLILARAER